MEYNSQIRLRGRPWYQAARRVPLGYELDPAENRGFVLTIPAYLVIEEVVNRSPSHQLEVEGAPSFMSDLRIEFSDIPNQPIRHESPTRSI